MPKVSVPIPSRLMIKKKYYEDPNAKYVKKFKIKKPIKSPNIYVSKNFMVTQNKKARLFELLDDVLKRRCFEKLKDC